MAYATGTAVDTSGLLSALRSFLTANGWTLAGNVLHKGGCYVETTLGVLDDTTAPAGCRLQIRVGNGIDGSNELTDPAPRRCGMGQLANSSGSYTGSAWDWPVTYHIHAHTSPDEVFMCVNYGAGQFWQWVAFGKSPGPGNAGTGNWSDGTLGQTYGATITYQSNRCSITVNGGGIISNATNPNFVPYPFWISNISNLPSRPMISHMIHGCIEDSGTDFPVGTPRWNDPSNGWDLRKFPTYGGNLRPQVSAFASIAPLLSYSPNAWNNEAHLIPVQIIQGRPSDKVSVIGEIKHIRLCRNDFIDPGTVLVKGPDKWKVYPAYSKNVVNRNGADTSGGGTMSHSGTFAIAARYDGP